MALYLLTISVLCLVSGTNALSDGDVGVVVAGVISGLILIAMVVGVPMIIYLWKKRREPKTKRNHQKHFANGSTGKPTANGFPKPYPYIPQPYPQPRPRNPYATPERSHRGVPDVNPKSHGSKRGAPRGMRKPHETERGPRIVLTHGRHPPMIFPMGTIGPSGPFPMPGPRGRGQPPFQGPGPYGYPHPMMYPYFFPPQFPMFPDNESYDDDSESDEERPSNRSTMREQKIRYRRSFLPDRQSKLVIKEIDSDEEKKIKEENRKKRSKSRSRSRTPERRRANTPRRSPTPDRRRSPSPERYRTSMHQDLYTEVGRSSKRPSSAGSAGDTAAKIDELFSFSDASAKAGDIIFVPPGQHVDRSPRRHEQSTPRRDPSPVFRRSRSPSPVFRREPTPPVPERKPETSEYHYASVIRPSEEPIEQPPQSGLGVSMSERLQNIVDTGHTTVEHDLEKEVQYPPKRNLSKTTRPFSTERSDYPSPAQRLSASARPDLHENNRYSFDDYRRPPSPPVDIPNDTPVPTPRQSLIRRPPTPPNDIPESARSMRPSTPPFDGDDISRSTSTPAADRKLPPAPPLPPPPPPIPPPQSYVPQPTKVRNPSNLGNTQQARSAFSNLVLKELRERHRMPETDTNDDHYDSEKNKAVNFSASPPEIIPRSQPNSPRTSQNLNPDPPLNNQAPPPAPPPPPPPPPFPK